MRSVKILIFCCLTIAALPASAQQLGINMHYVVTHNEPLSNGGGIGWYGDIIVWDHLYIRPQLDFIMYAFVQQQQIGTVTAEVTSVELKIRPRLSILYSFNTPEDKFSPFIGLGGSYLGFTEFVNNQNRIINIGRAIVEVPAGIMYNRIGGSNFGILAGITPGLMIKSAKHSAINPDMGKDILLLQFNLGGHFYIGKN